MMDRERCGISVSIRKELNSFLIEDHYLESLAGSGQGRYWL